MVNVMRTFTVDKPVDVVIDYLKDFSNAVEWDPGTMHCTRQDDGPVRVGSTWHNVSKVAGRQTELLYRLDTLDPGRIVFVGENAAATSTDDITLRPHGAGSEITYRATIELHGAARVTGPVLKLVFEQLANRIVERLTNAIAAR